MNRDEVIARRVAAHGLVSRRPAGGERAAAAACGLPDSPAGSARDALAARVEGPPDLTGLVAVWGPRGATYVVPPDDVAVFTRGALPPDEASARKAVGTAARWLDEGGWTALDAIAATGAAMREAVDEGVLARDELHAALRRSLPPALLWPCRGCGSRHAHPSVWRAAGLLGEVVHGASQDRAFAFRRWDGPRRDDETARRELVTRVLRCHGPLTPAELGGWLGTGAVHAKALLALVATRRVERAGRPALALAEAQDAPPRMRGLRLLAAADPLLDTRDRATLVPDAAARAVLWPVLARPGAVLADGEVVGAWRARRRGDALEVRTERFAPFDEGPLEAELAALGAARGLPAIGV